MTSQVGPGDLGPLHCIVNHKQITDVAEHVSSCKLMFSSESEDLHTKMFTKTMNFPVKKLVLVSLCIKKLKFKDLALVLDKTNGRSRPKTTSGTHNDRIGFCCSLKPVCFRRYEPGKRPFDKRILDIFIYFLSRSRDISLITKI